MNFKLSPSDLTYLYEGCKFCFWLKVRHGISQPSMPMPGIFSAIAGRQKEFYADLRTEKFCPALPPGKVILGEKWVQSKVLTGTNGSSSFIKGKFDAVLQFDDGSYGVIDFKTASPSDEKAEMYGRQLHAYAYALENPNDGALHLTPVKKLGLIFFEPNAFEQQDLERQIFSGKVVWIEVERNDGRFMQFLHEVMLLLGKKDPPDSLPDCNWCQYRSRMKSLNLMESGGPAQTLQQVATDSPLCPRCNSPMNLRKGKFGEFWSCQKYPECKGTRNVTSHQN